MEWLSKRKNAALLCFGLGGVLALLVILYAPVRMSTVVLGNGELLEMGFHCAEPKNPEQFVYVKDEQACTALAEAIENISLRRIERKAYVRIREPIYIVDPVTDIGELKGSFTVDSRGTVYCGNIKYRPMNDEEGLELYQTMAELWQQVKK